MSSFSRLSPARRGAGSVPPELPGERPLGELAAPLRRAIGRARLTLLEAQDPDGAWRAPCEAPPSLVAWSLAAQALGGPLDRELAGAGHDWLLSRALATGGWAREPEGDFDLETSLWAYWATKLLAPGESSPELAAARARILAEGGAAAANGHLRYAWALAGQLPYEVCPPVPPEWLWLMGRYRQAPRRGETERAQAAALALVWAERPLRPIDGLAGVRELFRQPSADWPRRTFVVENSPGPCWQSRALQLAERVAGWLDRHERAPFQGTARRALGEWLRAWWNAHESCLPEHPASIWAGLALRCTDRLDREEFAQPLRQQLDGWLEPDRAADEPSDAGATSADRQLAAITATSRAVEALRASGGELSQHALSQAAGWLTETLATESAQSDAGPPSIARAQALAALARLVDGSPRSAEAATPQLELIGHGKADDPDEARDQVELASRIAAQVADVSAAPASRPFASPVQGYDGVAAHRAAAWRPGFSDQGEELLAQVAQLVFRARRNTVDEVHRSAVVRSILAEQRADGGWPATGPAGRVTVTAEVLAALLAAGLPVHRAELQAGLSWLLAEQRADGRWSDAAADRAAETSHQDEPAPLVALRPTAAALRALVAAGLPDQPGAVRGGAWLVRAGEDTADPAGVAIRLTALAEWSAALAECPPPPACAPVLQLVAEHEEW